MMMQHCHAFLPDLYDLGPCVGDDPSHLHAVPSRTPAHDVPIKAVQDALVGQLQAVI